MRAVTGGRACVRPWRWGAARGRWAKGVVVAGVAATPVPALADVVTFNFSQSAPSGHAAAAAFAFDDVANTVTVRIENTISSSQSTLASRALTGLFWDMSPGVLPVAGVDATHGGIVGNAGPYTPAQLWAFRGDLDPGSTPFGTQFGLGASGFGVFGSTHMLAPGGPHPEPFQLDGAILSETGSPYTGQHLNPMFRSFVEFVFHVEGTIFAGGIDNFNVNNVSWQFGPSFSEPSIHIVPLPPSVWAGFAGLAGVAGFGLLRRRSLRCPD